MKTVVYIATSIDGYIADKDGGLDWLTSVPNPDGDDMGFADFMGGIDAIVMGRVTFDTVVGFGQGWPYPVPGMVLSETLTSVPEALKTHVTLHRGTPDQIVKQAANLGFDRLYIDGGQTVQRFLQADLIDEMIITEIPLLLGGGSRLFGLLDAHLEFELVDSKVLIDRLPQRHYRRSRG